MTMTDQTQEPDDIGKRLKENLCPRCETKLTEACATLVAMGISTGHADTAAELVGECITNLSEMQAKIKELEA